MELVICGCPNRPIQKKTFVKNGFDNCRQRAKKGSVDVWFQSMDAIEDLPFFVVLRIRFWSRGVWLLVPLRDYGGTA